jgi:hypothetical protein
MRRTIGLIIAGLMLVAGFLAITGIPSIAGGSGASRASAATTAQQIGMKVLLITDSTDGSTASGIAYADWVNTLKREGVPYDTWVTSAAMPALSSTAADGTGVANYEGVVAASSGALGMTTAQWTTLQTFEQHFSVRQITAYVVPSSDYGLTATNPVGSYSGNTEAPTLTTAGSAVFPYLKKVDLDAGTFGYKGTAGANDQTLISGNDGSSLLGIYTTADGRQTMYQTFNENSAYLQSELLRHGELNWLTRDTYFGDQRNYLETHIDDNFLSDDSYTVGTGVGGGATDYNATDALREQPADVTAAAAWSKANNFRIDMLYNGGGSQQYSADNGGSDPLLTAFQADKNDFGWVNHTWDHPNIDQGCATQAYIQSEISQNTTFATGTLGLTANTDPTKSLGVENPGELVTGEHSGLANLVPGNPGTVDPPEFNALTVNATGGTLPAGTYTYAITDQFSTTGGESSASEATTPSAVVANGSVTITWDAACHAADYKLYREVAGSNSWDLVTTIPAKSTDFGNSGTTELTYTDTGTGAPSATAPPTVNNATESPYEQNTGLVAAFTAAHITDFGSDASKPYPNPATSVFTTTLPSEYPAGSSFTDAGATAIPRYPTNIYYNAATSAQEANEYETLYDSPTCISNAATTCNPAGTVFTMADIVNSIDFGNPGMFSHIMGNDPRPHYFHQTNMMSQNTGVATTSGDGLYYQVMNPLLAQYNTYFAANAPIDQLTMQATGNLLNEQGAWATAAGSQVTGSIEGNIVTVKNGGAAMNIPLTGITGVGSLYGGTQSGWVNTPAGSKTYTALAAWPALPAIPPVVTVPTGPAPGTPAKTLPKAPAPITPPGGSVTPTKKHVTSKPIAYAAVQVKPKTVSIKHHKVTVSLACKATKGKTAKNKLCAGSFTLTVAGHKLTHRFRFRSPKTHRFTVTLSTKVMTAATRTRRHHRHKMVGSLLIKTTQSHAKARQSRGTLTIRV